MSNIYQLKAIVRILERKGIMKKQEVLDELKIMKWENEEKARGN